MEEALGVAPLRGRVASTQHTCRGRAPCVGKGLPRTPGSPQGDEVLHPAAGVRTHTFRLGLSTPGLPRDGAPLPLHVRPHR